MGGREGEKRTAVVWKVRCCTGRGVRERTDAKTGYMQRRTLGKLPDDMCDASCVYAEAELDCCYLSSAVHIRVRLMDGQGEK